MFKEDFQDNIIDEHNITKFKDEITYHIREYSGTDRPFKINNSWMTRCDKGHYAVCHEHGWSDISGVYYLKTNGEDGQLYFPSPHRLLAGNFIISRIDNLGVNCCLSTFEKIDVIDENSSMLNFSISISLSHINLKATDCTLPADNPR